MVNYRSIRIPKGKKRKVIAKSKCGQTVSVEAKTKNGKLTFVVESSDGIDIRIDNSPESPINSQSRGE